MLSNSMGVKEVPGGPTAMEVDQPINSTEDDVAAKQASRLQDLASKVEKFVEGEGDVEGARFEE